MRIKFDNDFRHYGSRSYLDTVDDIIGLPLHKLMRITRVPEVKMTRPPDEFPAERTPDFLYRLYGLASQI